MRIPHQHGDGDDRAHGDVHGGHVRNNIPRDDVRVHVHNGHDGVRGGHIRSVRHGDDAHGGYARDVHNHNAHGGARVRIHSGHHDDGDDVLRTQDKRPAPLSVLKVLLQGYCF